VDPEWSALILLSWIQSRTRIFAWGSGFRRKENSQNLQRNLIFSLSKRLLYLAGNGVFSDLLHTVHKYNVHVKKSSTSSDGKVWPGFGSAWIPFGLAPWIWIRIATYADQQQHCIQIQLAKRHYKPLLRNYVEKDVFYFLTPHLVQLSRIREVGQTRPE